MKNFYKSLGLILIFSSISYGEENFDYYITRSCKLNKSQTIKSVPSNFNNSNNLTSGTGSSLVAQGKIFILTGKIVDVNCVPVSDAKVNLWQADSYGIGYKESDSKINKIGPNSFQFTGTANTDNLGLFHFATILPNYSNKKNGEIYLKATIEDVGEFYKIININEKMLEKNDLYLINPKLGRKKYDSLPQYKFTWTLELSNNFVNY